MNEFIQKLIHRANIGLPGVEAQYKMAPTRRIKPDEDYYIKKQKAPKSSVLVLLYPKSNNVYIVLIERPQYKGVHSGQISFPGGKVDLNDLSPLHTALRETYEELGVTIFENDIIAPLTSLYIPASNFEVFPYLAWKNVTPTFLPDAREVASLIETPISVLLNDACVQQVKIPVSAELIYNAPCYKISDKIIWGATAMIISELKELIKLSGAELYV